MQKRHESVFRDAVRNTVSNTARNTRKVPCNQPDKRSFTRSLHLLFSLVVCTFLVACGGGSGSNGAGSSDTAADESPQPMPDDRRIIRGSIYNVSDGQPVSGATITTSPVTQTVRSNLDGTFQVIDVSEIAGSFEYALRATKLGFTPVELRVAATPGENIFDVALTPDTVSFVASPDLIGIPFERNTATLFVNSTSSSTGFTASSDVDWLSISPDSGTLENSEAIRLTLTLDRSLLGAQPAATSVVIRSDTGDAISVPVDVQIEAIEPPRDTAEVVTGTAPMMSATQADCRRPDILRLATQDPNFPLVVFPQTAVLPGDEGNYTITQLPFLVYADSFQINEPGTLTVRHTTGADESTGGTLFDIDSNNVAEVLADDSTPPQFGRRSDISADLQPGIYCYLLRPPNGVFLSFAQFGLQVEFVPE